MSEKFPSTPNQPDIDRDGGLYDQARTEDGLRRLSQRLDQNEAYATYADNIQATQDRERAEQDEAYATYEHNIQVAQQREDYEGYADSLTVATQEREDAELLELQKKLRKEKTKRRLGKVAAGISMIPGIAFVADVVQEERVTSSNNKRRRAQYKQSNGTMFGNKKKGYDSTLGKRFKDSTSRYTGGKDNDLIIKDLQTLIEENERRRR